MPLQWCTWWGHHCTWLAATCPGWWRGLLPIVIFPPRARITMCHPPCCTISTGHIWKPSDEVYHFVGHPRRASCPSTQTYIYIQILRNDANAAYYQECLLNWGNKVPYYQCYYLYSICKRPPLTSNLKKCLKAFSILDCYFQAKFYKWTSFSSDNQFCFVVGLQGTSGEPKNFGTSGGISVSLCPITNYFWNSPQF